MRKCLFVNPWRKQRVIDINQDRYPCGHGNVGAGETLGIASAIPSFVVAEGNFTGHGQDRVITEMVFKLDRTQNP